MSTSPTFQTKGGYAMKQRNRAEQKNQEEYTEDPLTAVLRKGARDLLAHAVEEEVTAFLATHADICDDQGRHMIVLNGHLPERTIQTGIGGVLVRGRRVRDQRKIPKADRIQFTSQILPRYLRRSKSLEELIPWLYLKGISTGDFSEALRALVGSSAGLSPATVCRLKAGWQQEWEAWQQRDLTGKRYVYFWVDGLHLNVRMEDSPCLLVVIGATADGHKELVAVEDGIRESEQSWKDLLLTLHRRGLTMGPDLATGDGALGFWKALPQVYGPTKWQRCWVHKTANVLNKLPKSLQAKAKAGLHDIWMAPTKAQANKAFDGFLQTYEAKYPKVADCLQKDREALLAFYQFPAEHWQHIRTTNPIESTFATVRLRTAKTRGCLSRATALTMAFQLVRCAEKTWRRLRGYHRLVEIIEGITFVDGESDTRKAA
jgi:transposase-like protein